MPENSPRTTDEYDLFCRGKLANLYPFFHQLRSEDPVHWSEPLNSWILTRYADVWSALRDQRLSASRVGVFMNQLPETMRVTLDPLGRHLSQWVSMSDPPAHTRLRRLVNKAFTPGIVEGMRGHVQEIVDDLLDEIQSKGKADLIADFAYELPATVISEMLGVPVQDRDRFKRWAENVMAFTGGGALALPEIAEQSQKSLFEMYGYFGGIIADRRSRPQDDLISALSRVEEQGDMLTEEELLGICDQLLTAGHDTTRNLIGNGMLALLRNPDQLEKLRLDPSLIGIAVEELLRFDSPLQRQTRVALEDLSINGRQIRRGQPVLSMLGAANRDPAQFPDPDCLDICRQDNRHVAFGSGIHFCLGAPLARLEGQIATNAILRRFPSIQLASDPVEWRPNMSVRGLKALRVTF